MRSFRTAAGVFVALVLVFLADRPAAAAETIRIGYLGPLTGIFAQARKDMLDGLKLSLEQINYQAGGRARLAVAGTPEDCIEQIRAAEAAGATQLMFTVSLAADPMSTVELFGREVLPALAR